VTLSEWAWFWSRDGERYYGPFLRREDAIDAAKTVGADVVHVCEGQSEMVGADDMIPSIPVLIKHWRYLNHGSGIDGDANIFGHLTPEHYDNLYKTLCAAAAQWHEMAGVPKKARYDFHDTRSDEIIDMRGNPKP